MEGRTTPVLSIGASFGIVETVSSNGRIRGQPQRRGFESHAIPFSLSSGQNGVGLIKASSFWHLNRPRHYDRAFSFYPYKH